MMRRTAKQLLILVALVQGASLFAQPLAPVAPATQASYAQILAINEYRAAVQQLQHQYGVYDSRLGEALRGLGAQLAEAGEILEARDAFSHALQVSRINEGLYNQNQIPIIESLIRIDADREDWEAVNRHHAYLENLFTRIFEEDDPRLERSLRTLVGWHIDAANINLNGQRTEHLRAAHRIYRTRLRVAENTLDPDDPLLHFLQRRVAISEYQLYASTIVPTDRHRQGFYSLRERYLLSRD